MYVYPVIPVIYFLHSSVMSLLSSDNKMGPMRTATEADGTL